MPGCRLDVVERARIAAWWRAGWSCPAIARELGRDRSTVWREVSRNNSARHGPKNPRLGVLAPGRRGPYRWGYDCWWAQAQARARARRPRPCRLGPGQPLRAVVRAKLAQRWSPGQISAWLRTAFADEPRWQVSHETIYQALYLQTRGNLRAELGRQVALRSGRAARRAQTKPAGAVRSRRPWTVGLNISTRPAEAADRAVPGHWEGDLVIGARGSSAIITLVERSTRYVMLGALPDSRVSDTVVAVLADLIGRLPAELRRSLTWDNGAELAQHAKFKVATGCPVFFADPHAPWQRGSNENTNGLLRQYFPKGRFDFRTIDQAGLDTVARQLNGRPRQTLGWHTPAEELNKLLVATTT